MYDLFLGLLFYVLIGLMVALLHAAEWNRLNKRNVLALFCFILLYPLIPLLTAIFGFDRVYEKFKELGY